MMLLGASSEVSRILFDNCEASFGELNPKRLTKDFSQEQAKLTASIAAEAKLIQTPHKLLQLLQSM